MPMSDGSRTSYLVQACRDNHRKGKHNPRTHTEDPSPEALEPPSINAPAAGSSLPSMVRLHPRSMHHWHHPNVPTSFQTAICSILKAFTDGKTSDHLRSFRYPSSYLSTASPTSRFSDPSKAWSPISTNAWHLLSAKATPSASSQSICALRRAMIPHTLY